MKVITFWYEKTNETNGTVTLCVDQVALIQMLQCNGFRKMHRETDVLYVRLQDGILTPVTQSHIRSFVNEYVDALPQMQPLAGCQNAYPPALMGILLAKTGHYFSDSALEHLLLIQPNPVRDTKDQSNFFFSNGVVSVTAESATITPYAKLKGLHVWESQVKAHEINIADTEPSDMQDFFDRISAGDQQRYNALLSNVGYCLHRFKHGESKMVFFMDESEEASSEGGTGKGIILKCISNMRLTAMFNGKMIDWKSQFLWQRVDESTEMIAIDELPENFDFGRMFALATSGIEINKKGLKAFYIPDEHAPKFVWATNYMTRGIGASYERRQSNVPLYRAFGTHLRPVDVYGKLFFADWDTAEWNAFYVFMLCCCKSYLTTGLMEYHSSIMAEKQMNCEIEQDMRDYIETHIIVAETNEVAPGYSRAKFLADYRVINPFPDSQLKVVGKELYGALKKWCKLTNRVITEKRTSDSRTFKVIGKVQIEEPSDA